MLPSDRSCGCYLVTGLGGTPLCQTSEAPLVIFVILKVEIPKINLYDRNIFHNLVEVT